MASLKFFTKCGLLLFVVFSLAESKIEYSEKEKQAIARLRGLASALIAQDEFYQTDQFLMRWLGARNMDVAGAYKMMREAFEWRISNKIDASLLNQTIYNFTSPPYTFTGYDKEGRPIVLFTPTSVDLRKLVVGGKRYVPIRVFDQMLEKGFYELKKIANVTYNGDSINQLTAILDLSGFNARQHLCLQCLGIYTAWFVHLENYYPGGLKNLVFINLSRVAVPFVELIKPYLSESTRKGLKVFGVNKKEWTEYLLSIIPANQLPYRFGGTSRVQI